MVGYTRGFPAFVVIRRVLACEHDDGNRGQGGIRTNLRRDLVRVGAFHRRVGDDHVWLDLRGPLQERCTALDRHNTRAFPCKGFFQHGSHGRAVVRDEDRQ